jgi:hypothetical protein
MERQLVAQQGVDGGAWETRHREPLGVVVRGFKYRRLVPVKAQAIPSSLEYLFLSLSLCVLLFHFSFAIYLFSCADRRTGFDGFHVLLTDCSQICSADLSLN